MSSGEADEAELNRRGAGRVGGGRRRWSRRSRRTRVLVGLGAALVVVWLALATVELASGLSKADQGLADVQQAKAQLSAPDLVAQAPATPSEAASRSFGSAHAALTSPLLAPFDIVPVLGRQIRGGAGPVGCGGPGVQRRQPPR